MAKSKTSWKQGQSGNPNGRPKRGESLSEALRSKLEDKYKGQKTYLDAIVDKVFSMALKGNIKALSLIFERTEGKVSNREETPRDVTHEDVMNLLNEIEAEPRIAS